MSASLFFFSFGVSAEPDPALTKKLAELRKTLSYTERELSSAEKDLKSLDQKIAESSLKIRATRKKILSERQELAGLRKEQEQISSQRVQRDDELIGHIRSMYMIGRQPVLKLVLNQEDPNVTGRLLQYFDYMNRAYLEEIERLTHRQQKLETLGSRLASSTQRLTDLLDRHTEQNRIYNQRRDKRRVLVTGLRNRQEDTRISISRLLNDQKQLEEITRETGRIVKSVPEKFVSGTAFAKLKGRLAWPVKGKVIARFGRARLSSGQLNWRGILIKADEGDEVRAVADGTVVFSDWLRGYGYVVIVDHGTDYLSLYGHNQALFKEVGEKIKAGDTLALVGQTGSKETPALYFEIRHHGDPINPQRWILARR